MKEVIIGKIIGSYKLEGAFKVISSTSFVNERFKEGSKVYIGEEKKEDVITSSIRQNDLVIISISGITSKEDADGLKGKYIYAEKDTSLLAKGQNYYDDIVGCQVINQDNVLVGVVTAVEEFPAQLTLRIKGDKKEDIFIPYIKQFIVSVDIENKIIKVNTIKGML